MFLGCCGGPRAGRRPSRLHSIDVATRRLTPLDPASTQGAVVHRERGPRRKLGDGGEPEQPAKLRSLDVTSGEKLSSVRLPRPRQRAVTAGLK